MQDSIIREWDILAIINTSLGEIKIKFFPELTPKTFKNFITHSKSGYYNWTIFHRVINKFMIQGWDPTSSGMGWESIYWKEFKDEFNKDLKHIKWALSMANAWPNTNWSQFFIVQATATPHLNWYHSVFWQVVEWLDIVDEIANQKVDRNDRPLFDIVINWIEIKQFKDNNLQSWSQES